MQQNLRQKRRHVLTRGADPPIHAPSLVVLQGWPTLSASLSLGVKVVVVQRPALLAHVHAADVAPARGLPAVFAVLFLGASIALGVELPHLALLAKAAPPLLFNTGNLGGGAQRTVGGNAPVTHGVGGSIVTDQHAANTHAG